MKAVTRRKGFTLIEVVIAAAIIISIFSILYGTYFAISSSTKSVRAKQTISRQAGDTMILLVRQIRCSYAKSTANQDKPVSNDKKKNNDNEINYFYGNSDHIGEVLHFITTNSFPVLASDLSEGLFDVTYKLDRNEGVLYISQQRFVGKAKKAARKEWTPIADNVRSFELEFFDGQHWAYKWSYKNKQKLPTAVRIEVAFENQTGQIYKCSTAVNIYCGTGNEKTTLPDRLTAVKNR